MGKTVTDENIRVRAYYIWQETGEDACKCWYQACAEMLAPVEECCKKTACHNKTSTKKTTSKKAEKPAAADVPFYGVKKKK